MEPNARITAPAACLALALLSAPAAADIYTWVDANGVTHYSTTRPTGQQSTTFATDPAFRTPGGGAKPSARPAAGGDAAETQALRQRLETLEGLLDSERSARVSDLKDQLESERDRVRRLEAERNQWSEMGGLWSPPAVAPAGLWWNPAPVLVVPGHGKPLKHGKHGKGDRPKVRSDNGRLPYPSISGPSSNLR